MKTPITATTPDDIRRNLAAFLNGRTSTEVGPDVDIFAAGMVSSLFALELVVHIENAFNVTVGGPDLKLDNFRTIDAMTALVVRLARNAGD